MQRMLQTHTFGAHTVAVLEQLEDDGVSYLVLVDGHPISDPLPGPPSFEDVVRLYARWKQQSQ